MCTFINESKDINSTALLTRFSKSIALRFEHNLEIQTTLIKGGGGGGEERSFEVCHFSENLHKLS